MNKRRNRKLSLGGELKKWFVPGYHNNHLPHLIRHQGLVLVAILIVVVNIFNVLNALEKAKTTTPTDGVVVPKDLRVLAFASDINLNDLLAETNKQRAAAGVGALQVDTRLNNSATMKAWDMFAKNYWAHVSPDGVSPWHWFTEAGYPYRYAGENLAKDFDTSNGVTVGWMNSPTHRANLLNGNFTSVGFAVVNGILQNGETTLVVAHYGKTIDGSDGSGSAPLATPAPTPTATPEPTPAPAAQRITNTPAITPYAAESAPSQTETTTTTEGQSELYVATPVPTAQPVLDSVIDSAAEIFGTEETEQPASTSPGTPATTPAVSTTYKFKGLFAGASRLGGLGWTKIITLSLLLSLLIIYVATHFAIWRRGVQIWDSHHRKTIAAIQILVIIGLMIYLVYSTIGTVG